MALILPIKTQPLVFLYRKSYHINYMSMSYSYLGNGLYAARLATLGALGAEGRISGTFCPLRFVLCVILCLAGYGKLFLVWFCPGLDQKIFSSSCLPKKFREDVTFGGTTYKVSGIPDGKISTLRFWFPSQCLGCSDMCIPLSTLKQYSITECHARAFMGSSFSKVGAKIMFCHPLSLSLPPLLNNYTTVNHIFKQKENCQLSSQIRQSLPYHSQVAKRCRACPWVVFCACVCV